MEPIPSYGDLMLLEDFIEDCKCGGLIDDDGTGYYATATEMSNEEVSPCEVADGIVDRSFTHVVWFNK